MQVLESKTPEEIGEIQNKIWHIVMTQLKNSNIKLITLRLITIKNWYVKDVKVDRD